MKNILTILFLLSIISSCKTEKLKPIKQDDTTEISIDTSKITILKNEIYTPYLIPKNSKYSNLNRSEILEVENLLIESIAKFNKEQEKEIDKVRLENPGFNLNRDNFIINLQKYQRQYVAYTTESGEKEVWVNCFCSRNKKWKIEPVIVKDGGNCYFNLKINLTKKICSDFYVNGDA